MSRVSAGDGGAGPVLEAYASLARFPEYAFAPFTGPANSVHFSHHPTHSPVCVVCALHRTTTDDHTYLRLQFWQGHPWDGPLASALNLEEFTRLAPPAPDENDVALLHDVLHVLRNQPPDATPSTAESALTRARVVPKSNARLRRNILTGLAAAGVLPQPSVPSPLDQWYTADIEWSAWNALGVSPRGQRHHVAAGRVAR